jgi:hypothetical protein
MPKENLKLDSRFSVIGAFWKPKSPDSIMTGTLVSDENAIEFTTAPSYERDPKPSAGMFGDPDITMIPALHGFTESGNSTLCQLVEGRGPNSMNFSLRQSITSRAFRVLALVEGMHINGIDDTCLTSAKFSFSGLSEFFPSAFSEKHEMDRIVVTIPLEPREILDFTVCEPRTRITVRAVPEITSGETDLSRLSKSVVSIEAQLPHPESLDSYRRIAGRLENLFSLLTGGSVALETLFVYRGDESAHLVTKRPGPRTHFDRMQTVFCSPTELASAIATWLCLPPKFEAVESLSLEVVRKSKLFVETEFLAVAQALEGFHRATTGKDSMLAKRIEELCGAISGPTLAKMMIDPPNFTSNVVVTRNYFTHAGSDEKPTKKPLKGKDLFLLNQKMRALLRGVMLLHLGLPEAKMADVLARQATKWTVSA